MVYQSKQLRGFIMEYWITYHHSTRQHTCREYGKTDNTMDIFRHYYQLLNEHTILSVDIDTKGMA